MNQNKAIELLEWAQGFIPFDVDEMTDFSDGVCFSYILSSFYRDYPIQEEPSNYMEKKYNLWLLETAFEQLEIPAKEDIEQLLRNDHSAKYLLLEKLRNRLESSQESQRIKIHQYQGIVQTQPQMPSLNQQLQIQPYSTQQVMQNPMRNHRHYPILRQESQINPLQIISKVPPGANRISYYGDNFFLCRNQNGFQNAVQEPSSQSSGQQEKLEQFSKVTKSTQNQISKQQVSIQDANQMKGQVQKNNIESIMRKMIEDGLGPELAQFHADLICSNNYCQDGNLLEYQRELQRQIQSRRQNQALKTSNGSQKEDMMVQQWNSKQTKNTKSIPQENAQFTQQSQGLHSVSLQE
ncbi:hypothetical protein pb186bvf_018860 [Paramecium bursaria]